MSPLQVPTRLFSRGPGRGLSINDQLACGLTVPGSALLSAGRNIASVRSGLMAGMRPVTVRVPGTASGVLRRVKVPIQRGLGFLQVTSLGSARARRLTYTFRIFRLRDKLQETSSSNIRLNPCAHSAQPCSTILVSPGFRLPFFGCQFPDKTETGNSNCSARPSFPDGAGGYVSPSHTCAGVNSVSNSSVAAAFLLLCKCPSHWGRSLSIHTRTCTRTCRPRHDDSPLTDGPQGPEMGPTPD
jgi:hypothetical protein